MPRMSNWWESANHNASIPARVRLRVFERAMGRCATCERKLSSGDKWDIDHAIALANGGRHHEQNLQLLCDWCHKDKTRADVALKSASYKRRKRHYGVRSNKRPSFQTNRDAPFKRKITGEIVRR